MSTKECPTCWGTGALQCQCVSNYKSDKECIYCNGTGQIVCWSCGGACYLPDDSYKDDNDD